MESIEVIKIDSNRLGVKSNKYSEYMIESNFKIVDDAGENVPLYTREVINNELYLVLGIGFFSHIVLYCVRSKLILKNIDNISVKMEANDKQFKINKKWSDILGSDFRIVNGEPQLFYLNELLQFSRSVGQFYTGYGKTELMLAIAESYWDKYPEGKVAILVPSTAIRNEIISRSKKWDVQIIPTYHKFDSKFQVINPKALFTTTKYKKSDPKTFKWLSEIDLIIIDEVHHIGMASYIDIIYNRIKNTSFQYALSATIDPFSGKTPTLDCKIDSFPNRLSKVVELFGVPRTIVKNEEQVLISYLRIDSTFVPKVLQSNYIKSTNIFFNSLDLIHQLIKFLERNPGRRLFIPINDKKMGDKLIDRFNKYLGENSAISVSANGVYPKLDPDKYSSAIDFMKLCPTFRVLVGTSSIFEGFDSVMINTVLLGIGKKFKMAIQPAGRGTRGEDSVPPHFLLPWDKNNTNRIVNKQTKSRYDSLKKEYVNYKFISLE